MSIVFTSTYTAPADGYYTLANSGTSIRMQAGGFYNSGDASGINTISVPVKKGQAMVLLYDSISNPSWKQFRFYYAEGVS